MTFVSGITRVLQQFCFQRCVNINSYVELHCVAAMHPIPYHLLKERVIKRIPTFQCGAEIMKPYKLNAAQVYQHISWIYKQCLLWKRVLLLDIHTSACAWKLGKRWWYFWSQIIGCSLIPNYLSQNNEMFRCYRKYIYAFWSLSGFMLWNLHHMKI